MYSISEFDPENQIYAIVYQRNLNSCPVVRYVADWFEIMEMWYEIIDTDSFIGEVLWDRYNRTTVL